MKKDKPCKKEFYGSATVGEKGQIVIPNDARENLGLEKGDKLLIFGLHEDMLALMKLSQLEKITSKLSKKMEVLDEIVKKTK